jgi:hypothetical protein
MSALYLLATFRSLFRPLWHDELFTLYLSNFPDLGTLLRELQKIDLNPPLGYIVTQPFLSIPLPAEVALRLPDLIAFWICSTCLLVFVANRLNAAFGLLAVIVFWYTESLSLATEARPYALLLMFFAIAMLCWQEAAAFGPRRRLALVVLPFALAGMIASHCFSVFYFLPFAYAELARWIERKRPDFYLWAIFIACACLTFFYIPLFNRYNTEIFPAAFIGGPRKILHFFKLWILGIGPLLALAAVCVAGLLKFLGKSQPGEKVKPTMTELAFLLGLIAVPIEINFALMLTRSSFWPRYAVVAALAAGIGFSWLVSYLAKGRSVAPLLASAVVFLGAQFHPCLEPSFSAVATVNPAGLEATEPTVPLVTTSPHTFLELDHYGTGNFSSRLRYLTDRPAAIQIAHGTMFESMAILKQYFPIRGDILPYTQFVTQHRHFLVLGMAHHPHEWLIPKLISDGARMNPIAKFHTDGDDMLLFDVDM